MNELAIITFFILMSLMALQALQALALGASLRSSSLETVQKNSLPKAAIILCLRGVDPFLADCVRALLNQNYSQYHLQIVVDSREDAAWNIVHEVIQRSLATHVRVSPLIARHETCSLKGSAIVQAISELDDSYSVVALVDADVVPHPDWLSEMIAPLADEQVGGTTGYRWYLPQTSQWGSLIRYIWNVPAVAFMCVHQSPWGGSMAFKLSVLHRAQLLETWTQGVSIDAPIRRALQAIGLKVKFVPTLMMINREGCDFGKCLRFITRQLLVTRLYHPKWMLIVFQVFTTTLALVLAIMLLLTALVRGNCDTAIWVAGELVSYILAMGLALAFVEQGVRRVVRMRGEQTAPFSALLIAEILVAILLTHLAYAAAMLSAILAKSVEWRGITYQIKGPWNVQLTEYRPYQISNETVGTNASLS